MQWKFIFFFTGLLLLPNWMTGQRIQESPHCIYGVRNKFPIHWYYETSVSDAHLETLEDSVSFAALKLMSVRRLGETTQGYTFLRDTELLNNAKFLPYVAFDLWAGNVCFIAGKPMMAVHFYRAIHEAGPESWACLNEKDSSTIINNAHINLGSCFNTLGYYDSAFYYYKEVEIRENNSTLMYNNMASALMKMGEFNQALSYLEKIDLNTLEKVDVEIMTKFNLLEGYTKTGQWEEAKRIWNLIPPQSYPFGDTSSAMIIHLDYLLASNDTLNFLRLTSDNRPYLEAHRSQSLFSMALDMKDVYTQNKGVFDQFWTLTQLQLQKSAEDKVLVENPKFDVQARPTEWIYGIGLVVVMVLFIISLRMRKPASNDTIPNHYRDLIEGAKNAKEQEFFQSLTLKESQMMRLMLQRESTKDIADAIKVSTSYAYNLRSSIRKKFTDLEVHEDFEEWLKAKMK